VARFYNALAALNLFLVLAVILWVAIVLINPSSPLNPFPPHTATAMPVAEQRLSVPVTRLFTPTPIPPTSTWTPIPTLIETSAGVQLNAPTSTPTAIPPTPLPATPSPDPLSVSASTEIPVSTSNETPVPSNTPAPLPPTPIPQTSAGGFELGGQVAGFGYPDQMKYAGMVWVKRQVRWGPGANTNDAAGFITDAHAKGFKILLSVLGDAESLRGGAPSAYADYTAFVGSAAALGADAIEVWNEMNIDREWPAGEINPASYTELLKQAYTAIRAKNPNTLVISGAPAPTGYFGGCTGAGCDDNLYIQGMVNAGALNYMDCMGIHYNEGVVSPSQTSGDPRGNPNHYTRYYKTMVDTYYSAGGGRKKLCFTELGYLSGDGYSPPLAEAAPGFAWAAGTSVEEQAQWLADAVSMAKASPKVRLIIVFNVDLTAWGSDPQGGYAIIRPGGGCPACETLHGVIGGR